VKPQIALSMTLSAFRIAHLDEWDIANDTISLPVYLDEYSVSFEQLKNGDIRISRNKQEVVFKLGDVSELGGKLAIIVGSTRHKSIGQK
jgi:hypothetical protein